MSKYALPKKGDKFILSEEIAIEQVTDMLDYYDIDVEALTADNEREAKVIETALDQVSRNVRLGKLQIERDKDGKLIVIHNLVGGEQVTYREINSKAKLAMERFDPTAGYSRIYAFMGSLSGVGKTGIEKFHPNDLSCVEVLGTVFLNA